MEKVGNSMGNMFAAVRKRLTDELLGQAAKTVVKTLVAWLAPIVLPLLVLLLVKGLSFFRSAVEVPGWVVAGASVAVLLSLSLAIRARVSLRRQTKRKRHYEWHGLEWELSEDFFDNADLDPYLMQDGYARQMVRGPYCSRCKRPVRVRLSSDPEPCPNGCGATFHLRENVAGKELPDSWRTTPDNYVLFAVLLDAIGDARSRRL